jgi:hypothetical protein
VTFLLGFLLGYFGPDPAIVPDPATRELHSYAAQRAARATAVPQDLILAIARVESRYRPADLSRVERGKRRTGVWRGEAPPRGARGPFFCGVLQARAVAWRRCRALRSLARGYLDGAAEIARWMVYARGDVTAALAGHGCGGNGMRAALGRKRGRACNGYPARVLAERARIRQ